MTINGDQYRSTVATVNGVFMIGVSNDVPAGSRRRRRRGGRRHAGARHRAAQRSPSRTELEELLAADPAARAALDKLSYSNKRRIVEPIDAAKTPETRQRRIDKAIETLRAG